MNLRETIRDQEDDVINGTTPMEIQKKLLGNPNPVGNEAVFTFISRLKQLPNSHFDNMSETDQTELCRRWYKRWQHEMFDGHRPIKFKELLSYDEVLIMFLDVKDKVDKYSSYDRALELAKSEPLPEEAKEFTSPKIQLLVALCYQLQLQNPDKPFFLGGTKAGQAMGVSQPRACIILRGLVGMGILKIRKEGTLTKAIRYQYMSVKAQNESSQVDNRLNVNGQPSEITVRMKLKEIRARRSAR